MDLSGKAIQICLERFPDGEFRCGPAESSAIRRPPFFDLATCMGSLEHFLDKRKALGEMRRVAMPDARFLV